VDFRFLIWFEKMPLGQLGELYLFFEFWGRFAIQIQADALGR